LKKKGEITWNYAAERKDQALDAGAEKTKEGLESGSQTLHGLAKKVDEKHKDWKY